MSIFLPKITEKEINEAKEDSWDFLFLFLDKYYDFMSANPDEAQNPDVFNGSQHTLMALNALYGQVTNGGFIQLIVNGYGAYIFDSPFIQELKAWGAQKIAGIVEEAKIYYNKYKKEIEKESTLEEFSEMYGEFTEFEPLDDAFYEVMDADVEIVKNYIENHLSDFASVSVKE